MGALGDVSLGDSAHVLSRLSRGQFLFWGRDGNRSSKQVHKNSYNAKKRQIL